MKTFLVGMSIIAIGAFPLSVVSLGAAQLTVVAGGMFLAAISK
jgi:hypothetical protein